jgi:hypothetical protein
MENLTLEQKEARVREHYESAYKVNGKKLKLKADLKPEEILDLYKKLRKLADTEFFYDKKRGLPI